MPALTRTQRDALELAVARGHDAYDQGVPALQVTNFLLALGDAEHGRATPVHGAQTRPPTPAERARNARAGATPRAGKRPEPEPT